MDILDLSPLPYLPDSCAYFERIRNLPGAVFLDSARPYCGSGRFDLMSAQPLCWLRSDGIRTRISQPDHHWESERPAFELLAEQLARILPQRTAMSSEWPFAGGIIGSFGYELGRRLAGLPERSSDTGAPDLLAGIYGWALMQDHDRRQAALIFTEAIPVSERLTLQHLLRQPAKAASSTFRLESQFDSNLSKDAYAAAFQRIQHYIHSGDCYQVNLAQRLRARASGDPWHAYRYLRQRMASPFSAYMSTSGSTILSFSPERLLHLADTRVETRPIKGTVRRSEDPQSDRLQVERLLASEKDRAENIMIVDLLRNDLSKSCRLGSVHVEKLCALESYANVHHLVSVVTGQLRDQEHPLRLLANCFPGGSITGAPKIRAMQIIDELEPDARSMYCGSIGYLSCDGNMDSSITIRTLVANDTHIYAYGGGGIVADSECEDEYRESLTKIQPLLDGLRECSA